MVLPLTLSDVSKPFKRFLFITFAFVVITPAHAHRLKAGVTTIQSNLSGTHLEITHQLHWDDVAHAFALDPEHNEAAFSGSMLKTIEALSRRDFAIQYVDGPQLDLEFIGAERESDVVFIYFLANVPSLGRNIIIDNRLLVSSFPSQSNLTTLKINDQYISLEQNEGSRRSGRVRF